MGPKPAVRPAPQVSAAHQGKPSATSAAEDATSMSIGAESVDDSEVGLSSGDETSRIAAAIHADINGMLATDQVARGTLERVMALMERFDGKVIASNARAIEKATGGVLLFPAGQKNMAYLVLPELPSGEPQPKIFLAYRADEPFQVSSLARENSFASKGVDDRKEAVAAMGDYPERMAALVVTANHHYQQWLATKEQIDALRREGMNFHLPYTFKHLLGE